MNKTALTLENKSPTLLLIIDKQGEIGRILSQRLRNDYQIVLVTKNTIPIEKVHIVKFIEHAAHIPDATYDFIVFIPADQSYSQDIIASIEQKAAQDKCKLLIISNFNLSLDIKSKTQLVTLGDIVGCEGETIISSQLNHQIINTLLKKKFILNSEGMDTYYPIHIRDVIEHLIKLITLYSNYSSRLLLYPHVAISQLAISHTLLKEDPEIKVDFLAKPDKERKINHQGDFILPRTYSSKEALKIAFKELEQKLKANKEQVDIKDKFEKKEKERASHMRKNKQKYILNKFILFLFTFLLLPPIVSLLFSFIGGLSLLYAASNLKQGNFQNATFPLSVATFSLSNAQNTSYLPTVELQSIGQENLILGYEKRLNSANLLALAISKSLALKDLPSGNLTKDNFENATFSLLQSLDAVNELENEGLLSQQMIMPILENKKIIDLLKLSNNFLPTLFGYDEPQTYLLLFQNNMELRPTGGFIGSYALITLQKGKISDFSIHNVYDADGQLHSHIEPPWQLRRYLPMLHWFLRDSNFDIDFPTASQKSAAFLEAETGQNVNGVIGVDLSLIRKILQNIGPVYVPEYKQTITADNFFLLTEEHSEKDSFPGSTQKQDFLKSLFNAISLKISSNSNINYFSLIKTLNDGFLEKHLMISFIDQSIQPIFSINGYSDSIVDIRGQSGGTVNDFLSVNEANLGINKVNYFIKRKISQAVNIDNEGVVHEQVRIDYRNLSNGSWPGGDYKNYLRLVVPDGSILKDIWINGVKQNIIPAITDYQTYEQKGFIPPSGLEVEQNVLYAKTIFGFLVIVPKNSFASVIVSYDLPTQISLKQTTFSYDHLVIKQPGLDNDPYNLTFTYPNSYNVLENDNNSTLAGNTLKYSSHLTSDLHFYYKFTKK